MWLVGSQRPAAEVEPVPWRIDNLERIGDHRVTVIGSPHVAPTPAGSTVEFNGKTDGLFLDVNPLVGLTRFTLEVVLEPSADGPAEQRFVHVEETGTGNRALIELRMLPGASWYLDTFLRSPEPGLTLLDRDATHAAGRWHVAALTYDGMTMAHYVDGVREASGTVPFTPLRDGRTSIGVRQNMVSWFKGRIRLVRITPDALTVDRLLLAGSPR